jgi:tetratricopeptide (TPR) repeat protein
VHHAKRRADPEMLVTLACAYAQTGDSTRSVTLVRQALALADTSPKINYIAGETYQVLGQQDKAIPLFAKALATGFRVREFERNPRLQMLRKDPAFTTALSKEKTNRIHSRHSTKTVGAGRNLCLEVHSRWRECVRFCMRSPQLMVVLG